MAKDSTNIVLWVLAAAFVLYITGPAGFGWHTLYAAPATSGGGTVVVDNGNGITLPPLNEPTLTFRGYNVFLPKTAASNEGVLVYQEDTEGMITQNVSMSGGTLASAKDQKITAYCGYDDQKGGIYTQPKSFVVEDTPSVTVRCEVCTQDSAPLVTIFDKYGQVSTPSANTLVIGADEQYLAAISIQAAADKCYGNPNAPEDKGNIICLNANNNYTSIGLYATKDSGASLSGKGSALPVLSMPNTMANNVSTVKSMWCAQFSVIADNQIYYLYADIQRGSADAGTDAINILEDDIAFDINADNDQVIWGFVDEDLNALGTAVEKTATMTVS